MNEQQTAKLRAVLGNEDWAIVIQSLCQLPLLWDHLRKPENFEQALAFAGRNLELWSPSALAFAVLTETINPPESADFVRLPLDARVYRECAAALESAGVWPTQSSLVSPEYRDAALIAFGIRDHWLSEGVNREFFSLFGVGPSDLWECVTACVYGLTRERDRFFEGLINPQRHPETRRLGIKAILANPLSLQEKARRFERAIKPLTRPDRLSLMRQLSHLAYSVAEEVADKIVTDLVIIEGKSDDIEQVSDLIHAADLLHLSGRYADAIPLIDQAAQISRKLQSGLAARIAEAAALNNDRDTAILALSRAETISPDDEDDQPSLSIARLQTGTLNPADLQTTDFDLIPENQLPGVSIAKARLAFDNQEQESAENIALNVTTRLLALSEGATPLATEQVLNLASLLMELNHPREALALCQHCLSSDPANARVLSLTVDAHLANHQPAKALMAAYLLRASAQEDILSTRSLIAALSSCGRWREALDECIPLAEATGFPDDMAFVAQAAYQCSDYANAAQYGQRAVHADNQNVEGHYWLALTLQALGNKEAALAGFETCNRLRPSSADPWIARVEHYLSMNMRTEALDILQRALDCQASDAHLHCLIAEHYLAENERERARSSFLAAYDIANASTPSFVTRSLSVTPANVARLAEGLRQVDEIQKAAQILGHFISTFPAATQLILKFAEFHFLLGQASLALSTLRDACARLPEEGDLHVAYLEALLRGERKSGELDRVLALLRSFPDTHRLLPILQAEVLLAKDEDASALDLFQKGLRNRTLTNDDSLKYRLAIGMATSALKLNKSELAIATLREYLPNSENSLDVLKLRIRAYSMAGLVENAKDALLQLSHLNPGDIPTLLWAAESAHEIGVTALQIELLEKGSTLQPSSAIVLAKLGGAYIEQGDIERGKQVLSKLIVMRDVDTRSLAQAASFLGQAGDLEASSLFLEKAWDLSDQPSEEILAEIIRINMATHQFDKALQSIDRLIELKPHHPQYLTQKSEVLIAQGKPQSAVVMLQAALERTPDSAELHQSLAQALVSSGELRLAFNHLSLALESSSMDSHMMEFGAVLAHSCALDEIAWKLLESINNISTADVVLLKAELALENSEDIKASTLIGEMIDGSPSHPRLLAIQSRLAHRMGQTEQAQGWLEAALHALAKTTMEENETNCLSLSIRSIAKAALELDHLNVSLYFAHECCRRFSYEPANHFLLAEVLIKRAEHQHLCNALSIVDHAPGTAALHAHARHTMEVALEKALALAPKEAMRVLQRWKKRGSWALHGTSPTHSDLLEARRSPGFLAAAIAAARRSGQIMPDGVELQEKRTYFPARVQWALANLRTNPPVALSIAEATLVQYPYKPELFAMVSLAAKSSGNPTRAIEYIEKALAVWPGEMKWQAIAGELYAGLHIWPKAIERFEKAVVLNKSSVELHLSLAKAYLSDAAPGNAIRVLGEIRRGHPRNPAIWECLANANLRLGDLEQAEFCVGTWVSLEPDNPHAIATSALIAFEKEDFESSLELSKAAKDLKDCPPLAHSLAAKSLSALGRHKEAIAILDGAIEDSNFPIQLILERAEVIRQIDGDLASLDSLSSHPEQTRHSPLVLSAIAAIHARLRDLPKAVETSQSALHSDKGELSPLQRAKVHFQLGALLRQSGQLDQALHHLSQAISLSPGLVEAHLELGETYWQRRESTLAIESLNRSISMAPNFVPAYLRAGEILLDSKDYLSAEAFLRRASAIAPQNQEVRRQLGAVIAMNLVHKPRFVG